MVYIAPLVPYRNPTPPCMQARCTPIPNPNIMYAHGEVEAVRSDVAAREASIRETAQLEMSALELRLAGLLDQRAQMLQSRLAALSYLSL